MLTDGDARRGRIVVLGMHRSGTSCIGELLAAMGAYFRPRHMVPRGNAQNPHGLFERMDLRRICHFILQDLRGEWWATSRLSPSRLSAAAHAQVDGMIATMLADLNAHEPWFIKEPRLCLLLPILRERLGTIVAVHVWRDPLEVAQSLRTRDAIPIEFGIALWERYVRLSFAGGVPGVIVGYNRLLADPVATTRSLLDKLTTLGVAGLRMPDIRELGHVIDPALRRSVWADPARAMLTQAHQQLLAALESGDPAHPEFAHPISTAQIERLAALESARQKQMKGAAYSALADAGESGGPVGARSRLALAIAALRYVPWHPARWLKWHRRGTLRQRLRQHLDACTIAASGAFDSRWYAAHHADLASSTIDPLMHFVRYGAAEGRDPAPTCSTMRHLHAMLEDSEQAQRRRPDLSGGAGARSGSTTGRAIPKDRIRLPR